MTHCEKCIHYEMCKAEMDLAPDDTFTFFPYNEDCPHFKNKSDYAEVKHGEWIFVLETFNKRVFECSCCNYIRKMSRGETVPDLCEKCGAKMDGGKIHNG